MLERMSLSSNSIGPLGFTGAFGFSFLGGAAGSSAPDAAFCGHHPFTELLTDFVILLNMVYLWCVMCAARVVASLASSWWLGVLNQPFTSSLAKAGQGSRICCAREQNEELSIASSASQPPETFTG